MVVAPVPDNIANCQRAGMWLRFWTRHCWHVNYNIGPTTRNVPKNKIVNYELRNKNTS